MRAFFTEYGLFVVAVASLGLFMWILTWLPSNLKSFSQEFISAITGVPLSQVSYSTEYVDEVHTPE